MTTSAHDVAALLIEEQHAAGRPIDKMQLQKLLYLVQGAHLSFWGEPAFREPLEAWMNGPVVAAVEGTYREASSGAEPLERPLGGHPERLPFETVDTVRTVLRHFGTWTARNLEAIEKRGDAPWVAVRGDLPRDVKSTIEIPLDLIRQWFDNHGLIPGTQRVQEWEATEEQRRAAYERRPAQSFELTPEEERVARRALERTQGR